MKEKDISPNKKKSRKKILLSVVAVILVVAIAVGVWLVVTEENKVMARCNGVKIRENTYRIYVHEAMQDFMTTFDVNVYTEDFWDVEIEGKLPEEHIKEQALEGVKYYAYYKAKCEEQNIGLSEEAYQNFISYYEDRYKDYDTVTEYGVEKKYFLEYLYEVYLFQLCMAQEAEKVEVTDEELKKAFDENREESASVTAKTVFLQAENENWEDLKNRAYAIKEEIQNGTSIDDFIAQESDYKGNNNGQFVVVSTSSYSKTLGKEYISSVLTGNEGDVVVLKTDTGYCVNQILKVEMKESAKKDLTTTIQEEKYDAQVTEMLQTDSKYDVKVTNQGIYDKVTLPGFSVDPDATPSIQPEST